MHGPDNHDRLVSRRRFLAAAGSAASLGWCPIPVAGTESPAAGKPRFTFVQLNDTHVQAPLRKQDPPRIGTYRRANDKLRAAVAAMNDTVRPDLVLHVGDLIHGERLDRLALDLQTYRELVQPLKAPLYPVMGNHEVVQQEGNAQYEKPFREMFGDDRANYTFDHGGLRFVMLNNSGATVVGGAVIEARNAWLEGVLKKHRGEPTILCCHIPVVPVRQEAVLAKSFGFRSYQAHDRQLLELVDAHADSIRAVLSGHLHLTGYVRRNGVFHLSIAGTASYPSDFAQFAVYDDRMVVQVHQLPEELATAHPSIHGRPRHAQEFTDTDHDTPEAYKIGRPDERRLTIPLLA